MKLVCLLAMVFALMPGALCGAETVVPAAPRILGISHMAVKVSDIDKALVFYRDFLGFAEHCRLNNLKDGSLQLVALKVGEDQSIELFTGLQPGQERLYQVAYQVEDAEAMRAYLAGAGVKVPLKINPGQMKNLGFTIKDPAGYTLEFVQYTAEGWTRRDRGKFLSEGRISDHITHGGVRATNATPMIEFYRGVLGFAEGWRGSKNDQVVSWVNLIIPESRDYTELMLDREVVPHFCLVVPDMEKAKARLEGSPCRAKYEKPLEIRVGKNRKRQLNLFDPDGTRVELMEANTIDGVPTPSTTAPMPQ